MTDRTPRSDPELLTTEDPERRRGFGEAFERLVGVMARLRGPDGCPWDRAQTLDSLRPYLVEEAYEVLDAIEAGTVEDHEEELGDLLLQVVFQAEIRRQEGAFDAADVAQAIADKLVRRHPHVFGADAGASLDEANRGWEAIKAAEKKAKAKDPSALSGVPRHLPALLRAQKVGEKASRVGFDWPSVDGALAKVVEELEELRAAIAGGARAEIEHELGDALFSLVNVARFTDVTAEDALRGTVDRFGARFRAVEAEAAAEGRALSAQSVDELEARWQAAKRRLEGPSDGQGKIS